MSFDGRQGQTYNVPRRVLNDIIVYFELVEALLSGHGGNDEKQMMRDLYNRILPWLKWKQKRINARDDYLYKNHYANPHVTENKKNPPK